MKTAIFNTMEENGWNLSLPLIQGGMGVGVSLSGLAGAVAKEGGMGVISTAQIGYDDPDFKGHEMECNLKAISKHIKRAKEISQGNGMVAVNVMVALQHYKEHVLAAKKLLKNHSKKLERLLERVNKLLLGYKRECENYQILDSIGDVVLALMSLMSELENFMDLRRKGQVYLTELEEKELLEFYFEVNTFLSIYELLDENYAVTNEVLCKEFGYEEADQREFAALSKAKFCDRTIVDTVSRNARDPQRKLGANERIIGPIKLLHKYGKDASVLEKTAAAAILYDNDGEDVWKAIKKEKTNAQIFWEVYRMARLS